MEIVSLLATLITVVGSGIATLRLPRRRTTRGVSSPKEDAASGIREGDWLTGSNLIFVIFAVIVGSFGVLTVDRYWNEIKANEGSLYFAVWLFFTMVAGMFVQVLAANYRAGHPLFQVEPSRLIFPLLFSLIVFYPIWALAAGTPRNLFPFYAAFLNGYFWESVVTAARPPAAPDSPTA